MKDSQKEISDIIKEFSIKVEEAKKIAFREGIAANAIVINTNFVKVPKTYLGFDKTICELPPMICGLEAHFTKDELPEKYLFAVTEIRTERERLISETEERVRKETANEILSLLDRTPYKYHKTKIRELLKLYNVEEEE